MITFYTDELTPCLKDSVTGDIYDTEEETASQKIREVYNYEWTGEEL